MGRRLVIKAGEHHWEDKNICAVVYELRSATVHNPLFFVYEL